MHGQATETNSCKYLAFMQTWPKIFDGLYSLVMGSTFRDDILKHTCVNSGADILACMCPLCVVTTHSPSGQLWLLPIYLACMRQGMGVHGSATKHVNQKYMQPAVA